MYKLALFAVFDMNMACEYTVGPEMHPFAFRVHAHSLGESHKLF